MITRQDYINKKNTHREYYAQFVNEYVKHIVYCGIGADRLIKSTDPHFNDIYLSTWDKLCPYIKGMVARKNVEVAAYKKPACSLSDCVCVLKEAARQIVEEETGCTT